jgi:putative tryptophan/tyrosine transport system substrate-binding protein
VKTINVTRRAIAAAVAAGVFVPVLAQQKVYRLAVLEFGDPSASAGEIDSFMRELGRLGFVEGSNLVVERRYARSDLAQLEPLAAELVTLMPDVIFTAGGTPAARALKKATQTIPVVFDAAFDPVGRGLVANLARPEGNLTGTAVFTVTIEHKRIQLLSDVVGRATSMGFLNQKVTDERRRALEQSFASLGPQGGARLEFFEAEFNALPATIETIAKRKLALVVGNSGFTSVNAERISELIAKHRLPAIADGRKFAEGGVLLTYSTDFVELYKRGADYVARILRGAKPGDLPIEHASRYAFVVNLRTAKALGLRIPQSMLVLADSVVS